MGGLSYLLFLIGVDNPENLFFVGPPKESILLTTIFQSSLRTLQITFFLHHIDLRWATFHIGPVKDMCTIPMHGHSGYYDSMWFHDSRPIKGTPWLYSSPVSS